MPRESVTVEEVANDPTNVFQITVHGDTPIKSLKICGDKNKWTYIEYANGGSCAGEPIHWHQYVRIT